MVSTKETIIQQCIGILHREDVKTEFKRMITPIVELILADIYPYIYLSLAFILVSFLLHLGIFVLLLRRKNVSPTFFSS